MQYVRIKPYNAKLGQLCERFCVGGQLFMSGQWYQLPDDHAEKLSDLKQGGIAHVFDILEADDYNQVVQSELAAAYMRAGVGVAFAPPTQAPAPSPNPKVGPRSSKFAGLQVAEVDRSTITSASLSGAVEDDDEADEEADEPGDHEGLEVAGDEPGQGTEMPDISALDRDGLFALGKANDITLSDRWGDKRLRSTLEKAFE